MESLSLADKVSDLVSKVKPIVPLWIQLICGIITVKPWWKTCRRLFRIHLEFSSDLQDLQDCLWYFFFTIWTSLIWNIYIYIFKKNLIITLFGIALLIFYLSLKDPYRGGLASLCSAIVFFSFLFCLCDPTREALGSSDIHFPNEKVYHCHFLLLSMQYSYAMHWSFFYLIQTVI